MKTTKSSMWEMLIEHTLQQVVYANKCLQVKQYIVKVNDGRTQKTFQK